MFVSIVKGEAVRKQSFEIWQVEPLRPAAGHNRDQEWRLIVRITRGSKSGMNQSVLHLPGCFVCFVQRDGGR